MSTSIWTAREHVVEHARRLAELLLRAHRRRPFDQLVVAAPNALWPFIEGALDSALRARLAGLVELDLEHAPAQELARAVAPVMQLARREKTEHAQRSTTTPLVVGGPTATAYLTTTRRLQMTYASPA